MEIIKMLSLKLKARRLCQAPFSYSLILLFSIFVSLFSLGGFAAEAAPQFDELTAAESEMSETFADIYETLDGVKWGGKDMRVALESLENIAPKIKIAATDQRVVVLRANDIIGNWPRPADKDWKSYGEITTAIISKLAPRSTIPASEIYRAAITAMMRGINESGKYTAPRTLSDDPHVLTTLGIAGVRTTSGDYVINTIFKGSSADAAGLEEGDILTMANGRRLRDLSDMEVLGLFNGFSSGTIKVRAIGRDRKEKSATLRRASIILADADVVLMNTNAGGSILEIIVHKITPGAVDIIMNALDIYKSEIAGIYLDLRATGGDDETAFAQLAGLLVGQVPVALMSEVATDDVEIIPSNEPMAAGVPIVAAVSNATNGAAEALAFALWENNAAVVIGVPTAGRAKLLSKLPLKNGGTLELLNREIKSGQGRKIDGRGFFPLVCLSNIRTADQKDAFVLNIKNREYAAKDFNDAQFDPAEIRRGCPNIKSGADEDAAASAVAMDILLAPEVYNRLSSKE
ncbi:MAG: PDZ domain-containing protein [Rickettsiales bacterium]|jgi:C-terminal processing protease CtpA/Prc|nr:PDZ domain-containing protein [Rickettsiales bacterium]